MVDSRFNPTDHHTTNSKAHESQPHEDAAAAAAAAPTNQQQQQENHRMVLPIAPAGGLGDASYAANSSNQGNAVKSIYPLLQNMLLHKLLSPPERGIVRVADLGCSSGMNTVNNMEFVLHTLKHKFKESFTDLELEFQVFFSDLPSNDFNTLFNLLTNPDRIGRGYFFAGVPGSFYGRLFPKASLHVAFSSLCLHWISKIPDEVQQRDCLAWNGGHVWIHGGNPKAAEAYAKVAKNDLRDFLNARSAELLPGGLLFVVMQGRSNPDSTKQYRHQAEAFEIFSSTWNDLVAEGVIQPESRDSFNLHLYYRTIEEVLEVVRECPDLKLEHLELLDIPILGAQKDEIGSVIEYGRKLANSYRSLLGGYVETHLGLDKAKIFDQRIEEKAIACVQARPERSVSYKDCILMILTHII
ncbi:hypothetical protein O6H91_12G087500 [Diphasiastrum complanatum]|uniref:Uncharacterized protein n=1 Tax=Diphasiastrum complanatum TaxID=34168 RepID=A0ACC2C4L0_DIPCM|nr:hypothetical protein O6H91_Y567200 [Diphasiastrum complanatum]KAJ7536900.1 hypothetical protein O6H91_12G087500 [Diphasiastrum complanatum]